MGGAERAWPVRGWPPDGRRSGCPARPPTTPPTCCARARARPGARAAARAPGHCRVARRHRSMTARRALARLGLGGHEGRRRVALGARALADAMSRALRRAGRCCWWSTKSGGCSPFAHAERFAGWDACLCFEAGERTPRRGRRDRPAQGRRHAARHRAGAGLARRLGPRQGPNALLALAAAAQHVVGHHDPVGRTRSPPCPHSARGRGAQRGARRRLADVRRARRRARVRGPDRRDPRELVHGAELDVRAVRSWPGMDSREVTPPAARAGERLGRAIAGRAGAAGPATPATSRRRFRSRSTGSDRAAVTRTRRTSSCTRRRSASAWKWRLRCARRCPRRSRRPSRPRADAQRP